MLYLVISCLNIHHRFAHIIDGSLLPVSYMSKQDDANSATNYGQIYVEFFTGLGAA